MDGAAAALPSACTPVFVARVPKGSDQYGCLPHMYTVNREQNAAQQARNSVPVTGRCQ